MAAGPVDWRLAEKVAVRVAGDDPLSRSYHAPSLASDVAELTPVAEQLVADVTGLRSSAGPATAQVVDRANRRMRFARFAISRTYKRDADTALAQMREHAAVKDFVVRMRHHYQE